jgi:hypothetical protein
MTFVSEPQAVVKLNQVRSIRIIRIDGYDDTSVPCQRRAAISPDADMVSTSQVDPNTVH